jgi:hypothetical protein
MENQIETTTTVPMITTTIASFALNNDFDYGTANAIIGLLVKQNVAKAIGTSIREDKRRGKRSRIFLMPSEVNFKFNTENCITKFNPIVAVKPAETTVANATPATPADTTPTTSAEAIAAMMPPTAEVQVIQTTIAEPQPTAADLIDVTSAEVALPDVNEDDVLEELASLEASMMSDKSDAAE